MSAGRFRRRLCDNCAESMEILYISDIRGYGSCGVFGTYPSPRVKSGPDRCRYQDLTYHCIAQPAYPKLLVIITHMCTPLSLVEICARVLNRWWGGGIIRKAT